MDIISAYREVGTYRGAAAICGTTHKTVKRVIERARVRRRRRRRGRPRARNYDAVAELVAERVRADRRAGSPRSGCCRPRGRRGTRGRRATSGGWSRRGKRCGAGTTTAAAGRRCGPRVSTWSSTGACWAGCTCSARCWPGRGCGSCASPTTSAPTRRWRCSRSASSTLGGVPAVVLADRMGCLKGGVVANMVVPDRGLRAVRRALRVPPGLLRGRRPGVEGHRGEPGRLRQDRPDDPRRRRVRRRPFADVAAANAAAAAWCVEVNAAVHSEICAVPAERLITERELLAPLPSLRAEIGRAGDPQGRPARLRPVRLGPLLGADPADRRPGRGCASTATGRCWSSPAPATVRSSPTTCWSPRVRRRSSTPTTAARGRRRAGRCARKPLRRRQFCALGPAAEAFITGAAAAGNTRLGPELAELQHAGRRARRARCSSTRWPGRSRSVGGAPPTCAPSSPPAPEPRSPPRPGTPWSSTCPPVPTRSLSRLRPRPRRRHASRRGVT